MLGSSRTRTCLGLLGKWGDWKACRLLLKAIVVLVFILVVRLLAQGKLDTRALSQPAQWAELRSRAQ